MNVIISHLNADFDCLGAMVAARRLFPDTLLVFPGAQEKNLRDFFHRCPQYQLDFTRLKEVDFAAINHLIIVDCQHSSRIGRFAELLGRPGLLVTIYDHHPVVDGDITPTDGIIRPCGSTTTILAQLLQSRGEAISADEATLMMLGIYEDTGGLTFPSTTVDDFLAAAWLLQQGGNLSVVAEHVNQDLTQEQVTLLNDLLQSQQTISLHGIDISIAHAIRDNYVGDIASLAHLMRDMEHLQVLFLVVSMGNRVYLVGRSRVREVNVGEVLRELGGGGHATAASASVRDLTLIQVLERLEELLKRHVHPQRQARHLMSHPVKHIAAAKTIQAAREVLNRYNLNAMPVMLQGHMVGVITRRIVERAMFHGLGSAPVTDYMHSEFMRATPDTPVEVIQDYVVGQNRRLVPVFEGERLVGVVTRTDLLRAMHAGEAIYDLGRDHHASRGRNLGGLLQKGVRTQLFQMLQQLGEAGAEQGVQVAVVGGFVRDLLLGQANSDVDITVEGDGIAFAEAFAASHQARVRAHHAFGTAVLIFPDDSKIDIASTRLEYYESPGALPSVERSSLKQDLYRRDFTINTLAIRLTGDQFGLLVDYYGGQRDIADKSIRVLHNLSFVEDPTRVFRAIRFEQRLGFHIAVHTENLIKNAVKLNLLHTLGGKRLLNELVLILREKECSRGVRRMAQLGLLPFIHPRLALSESLQQLFRDVQEVITWYSLLFLERSIESWEVNFLALCHDLGGGEFRDVCMRLSFSGKRLRIAIEQRSKVHELNRVAAAACRQPAKRAASEIYHDLHGISDEYLLYLMASTPHQALRRDISAYCMHLREVRPLLTGDDLQLLGIPPGPDYTRLLRMLLDARLDGKVTSRDEELQLVRQELAWGIGG